MHVCTYVVSGEINQLIVSDSQLKSTTKKLCVIATLFPQLPNLCVL